MRRTLLLLVIVGIISAFQQTVAQSDEIVVTANRMSRYMDDIIPVVTLKENADFVLVTYDIVCDTRDKTQRHKELTDTLNDLIARANKRADIELSIIEEYEDDYDVFYLPVPFEKVDPGQFTADYGRSDTSRLEVTVKTPIDDSITSVDFAEQKISGFMDTVREYGRTIIGSGDDPQLSVRNVERYRPALMAAILSDVKATTSSLGGTTAEITGLEQVIRWERSGPLELTLYIPYKVSVEIGE